jgi:hypothetical protein
MDIIGLVLAILKLANVVMGYVDRGRSRQDGRNEVIAQTLAEIADKAGAQRALKEKINAMPEAEVDSGLRDLEPK